MADDTIVYPPPRHSLTGYQGQLPSTRTIRPRRPDGSGRAKGTPNKLQATMGWMVNEAIRRNGGVEWITKWMKRNPDLAIPCVIKALVPRPTVTQSEDGQTSVHVHFLVTDGPASASPASHQVLSDGVSDPAGASASQALIRVPKRQIPTGQPVSKVTRKVSDVSGEESEGPGVPSQVSR